MINNLFTSHPSKVNESYLEHLIFAIKISLLMILGGLSCLIHAFFPFLFEHTGSKCIKEIKRINNKTDREEL